MFCAKRHNREGERSHFQSLTKMLARLRLVLQLPTLRWHIFDESIVLTLNEIGRPTCVMRFFDGVIVGIRLFSRSKILSSTKNYPVQKMPQESCALELSGLATLLSPLKMVAAPSYNNGPTIFFIRSRPRPLQLTSTSPQVHRSYGLSIHRFRFHFANAAVHGHNRHHPPLQHPQLPEKK